MDFMLFLFKVWNLGWWLLLCGVVSLEEDKDEIDCDLVTKE